MIVVHILLVLAALGLITLVGYILSELIYHKLCKPKKKSNKSSLSDAYIQGYRDMAISAGVEERVREQVEKHIRSASGHNLPYMTYEDTSLLSIGKDRLSYPPHAMTPIARQMIDNDWVISLEDGQTSRQYLGGTDEEFKDYYQGGLKFVTDMDETIDQILQERSNEQAKDKLIEARKKGLKEINSKMEIDLGQLNDMRQKAFSTQNIKERWDTQFKEIS